MPHTAHVGNPVSASVKSVSNVIMVIIADCHYGFGIPLLLFYYYDSIFIVDNKQALQ